MGIPYDSVERVQWRVDDGPIKECDFRIVNGIKYVPERTTTRNGKFKTKYGRKVPLCEQCGYAIGDRRYNYCPNCGAKVVE